LGSCPPITEEAAQNGSAAEGICSPKTFPSPI